MVVHFLAAIVPLPEREGTTVQTDATLTVTIGVEPPREIPAISVPVEPPRQREKPAPLRSVSPPPSSAIAVERAEMAAPAALSVSAVPTVPAEPAAIATAPGSTGAGPGTDAAGSGSNTAAPGSGSSAAEPPRFSGVHLKNPEARYPPLARRLGQEGLVTLRVQVSATGKPEQIVVAKTSGVPLLDEAAVKAVQNWSFEPARRGDTAIAAAVEVPIRFRLSQ